MIVRPARHQNKPFVNQGNSHGLGIAFPRLWLSKNSIFFENMCLSWHNILSQSIKPMSTFSKEKATDSGKLSSFSTSLHANAPRKCLPLVMKWDEVCLPLGLRFEYDLRDVHLSSTHDMVALVKYLLKVCHEPHLIGGSSSDTMKRTTQRVAITEVLYWVLMAYGRKFVCTYAKIFKVLLLKLVELREVVKMYEGLENSFVTTGTQVLLFYKVYGSQIFKPRFYVALLPILHASLCAKHIPYSYWERTEELCTWEEKDYRQLCDYAAFTKEKQQTIEPPVVDNLSKDDTVSTDASKDEKDENEIVEKVPPSRSWLSWIW